MLDLTTPSLPEAAQRLRRCPACRRSSSSRTAASSAPARCRSATSRSTATSRSSRSSRRTPAPSSTTSSSAPSTTPSRARGFDGDGRPALRLGSNGTRLFLPYSGRHHADQYEPTAHRLNISRIDAGRLVSERSFSVSDDIIRTAALDDARSLAFANSAAYLVDHNERRLGADHAARALRAVRHLPPDRRQPPCTHRRASARSAASRPTPATATDLRRGEARAGRRALQPSTACRSATARASSSPTRAPASASAPTAVAIEALGAAEVEALVTKVPTGYCYIPGGDAIEERLTRRVPRRRPGAHPLRAGRVDRRRHRADTFEVI